MLLNCDNGTLQWKYCNVASEINKSVRCQHPVANETPPAGFVITANSQNPELVGASLLSLASSKMKRQWKPLGSERNIPRR